MAGLRQSEIREKVQAYFKAQLDQYLDWLDRRGLSKNALTDAREEMLDHESLLELETTSPMWLPISRFKRVGMFTGARLNEICQMLVSDIQQDHGIHFLNIDDEGDERKRVKSRASKRKVPIHSELIRLGFLDFVESRAEHARLFYDFQYNRNGGYGRSLSRWFNNNTFLPKLGIKSRELVFHSFRHTMVTRLSQAGEAEPLVKCIVGHERSGVTQEVYFREGYTLHQLKDAIDKFSWR